MLNKILHISLRLLLLLLMLSVEYVLGLPCWFIFLSLWWLRSTSGRLRLVLLVVLAYLMAVVYNLVFTSSFLIFLAFNFLASRETFWERRQLIKMLLLTLGTNLFLSLLIPNFIWSVWTFVQLVLFFLVINCGIYFLKKSKTMSWKI